MRIKRIISILSILVLAFVITLCFTACDDNGNNSNNGNESNTGEHTHSFSMWEMTAEPSCTAQGKQTRICNSCGFSEYSQIPALGHTEVVDAAVPATCLVDGKTAGSHCSVCNVVITAQTTVTAGGHTSITDLAIAATCTTDGKTEGSHCSVCKTTLVAQTTIKASGHQYDEGVVVTPATCVKDGTKKYTCTVSTCKHTYSDTYAMPTYTATELYNQSIKYVGEIIVYDKKGVELGLASGFVYSSDGKIITNYHVIDGAYSATITINETTYAIKSILAYDENIDLAILKIDANNLTAAKVCKNAVQAGETVYAIGSSRGLTNTYSQGIITYADRVVSGVSHIQHDASITHGNSGGPLINVYGEVIGINTWGVSDSQNLNFAVFADEIDNLVYGTAMSLSDFYDLNNSAYDILLDWLLENYNASSDTQIRYDYYGDSTWYSLAYDTEDEYLYIDVIWEFDDGAELYLLIDFSYDPSQYAYYASYSYNGNSNSTIGYINAATFMENTALTYTSYEGTYWDKDWLINFYQLGIVDLLGWFDWATVYYDMGTTIKDMGFDVFEITEDEESDLDILIDHIVSTGSYDASTQWYSIRKEYDYASYDCSFKLVYNAENDNVFASMTWSGNDGTFYYTYLSLMPSSNGIYYASNYSVYSNGGFTDLNETWGYIDPSTFTDSTVISCVSYEGLPNDKSFLLNIYAGNIADLLEWMTIYFNNNNVGITIDGLGFTAYN